MSKPSRRGGSGSKSSDRSRRWLKNDDAVAPAGVEVQEDVAGKSQSGDATTIHGVGANRMRHARTHARSYSNVADMRRRQRLPGERNAYPLLAMAILLLAVAGLTGPRTADAAPVPGRGERCAPADIALVLDSTSSMDPAIADVKEDLALLTTAIEEETAGDYRLALVDFGRGVEVHVPFAPNNADAVRSALPALRQDGDNFNEPEAWDEALRTVVEGRLAANVPEGVQVGDFRPQFRPEAKKIVLLVTDARPAGFDDRFDEASPSPDAESAREVARAAQDAGIRIVTVFIRNGNHEEEAAPILELVAGITGAPYLETLDNASNLAEGLELAVTTCAADTDGDGLFDDWETDGYDANGDGIVDLDLPAMGADPMHKDLFLQVDWMPGRRAARCRFLQYCERTDDPQLPSTDALAEVGDAFARAPVSNPDREDGIKLHIDAGRLTPDRYGVPEGFRQGGEAGTYRHLLYQPDVDAEEVTSQMSKLRMLELGEGRSAGFTWAYYGHVVAIDERSRSDLLGYAPGTPGDKVFISGLLMTETREESLTLFHELGHTLGLRHGGDDDINYKPNYPSVMNYEFALGDGVPTDDGPVLDFSSYDFAPLDESELDEDAGVQPLPTSALPVGLRSRHRCEARGSSIPILPKQRVRDRRPGQLGLRCGHWRDGGR